MNSPYQSNVNVPLAYWEESRWLGELEGERQAYYIYFQLVIDQYPWRTFLLIARIGNQNLNGPVGGAHGWCEGEREARTTRKRPEISSVPAADMGRCVIRL